MSTSSKRQYKRGDAVWVQVGPLEFPGFVKARQCLGYSVFIEYRDSDNKCRTLDIDEVPRAELREREA